MTDPQVNTNLNNHLRNVRRDRNATVNRFWSSLGGGAVSTRRGSLGGRLINARTISSRSRTGTSLNSSRGGVSARTTSSQIPTSSQSTSDILNGRIGTSFFGSTNKQVSGERFDPDSIARRMLDTNSDGIINLEEVLLYVLDKKSKNESIPQTMYKLHPKFADVVQAVEIIDSNNNQDFENIEAAKAIVAQRASQLGEDLDQAVADFVLDYLNDNIEGIRQAAQTIDTNPDAEVSNIEVLTALLASRKGELNINDPNVDAVLRTNPNYDQLAALVASLSLDFDGNLSDEQAFDIVLALRGTDTGEAIIQQALFLGTNENLTEIENSVALLDSEEDGEITETEFLKFITDLRAGSISQADHDIAIGILSNREPYASIMQIFDALDTEVDGLISDDEVIDFTLASLRGEISLDANLVETIINSNNKVELIRSLITNVDTELDSSGVISDQEFIDAVTDILSNDELAPSTARLIEKILQRNANSADIYAAINFIDTDGNYLIGRTETINALLAGYRSETSELNPAIFNMILDLNSERADIEALLAQINPALDGNPSLDEQFNFITSFIAGDIAADPELIRAIIAAFPQAQAILETYELMDPAGDGIDLAEYKTALMAINRGEASNPGAAIMAKFSAAVPNANVVDEAITTLDTIEVNGLVSAEEFYQNFNQLFLRADNTVDMDKMAIFLTVSDIIFPDAAALSQFIRDVDTRVEVPVNIISDTEVLDALFKLNNNSIVDPGPEIVDLVLSRNPNKIDLTNLVLEIDQDEDGDVNDIEFTQNLIKLRKDQFSQDETLVRYVLNKNSKASDIEALIDAFDGDQDGTVGNFELFAELFANRTGTYAGLSQAESEAIINELKATNPQAAQIAEAVELLDPDGSGDVDYDEMVAAYLAINAGAADISDELKQEIPQVGGAAYGQAALDADELVDLFDADTQDGVISNIELARMILSDRAHDTFDSYDPELLEAVFRSNGNKDYIESLIAELDGGDGEIDRADLIGAIMSQRADSNTFGADYPMVELILAAGNDEFGTANSIISQIDNEAGNEGEISSQEAMNTLVAIAKSEFSGSEVDIANTVIDSNSEIAEIRTAFDDFGIDFDSENLVEELFTTWIAIQQGLQTGNYFEELVNAIDPGSEYDTYIAQFAEIDDDNSGMIEEDEFADLLIDVITGVKAEADYEILIDALSSDPRLAGIRAAINIFDDDGTGSFNDNNMMLGIQHLRVNQPGLLAEGYIQNILARNPYSDGVNKLLNLIDPDAVMTADEIVADKNNALTNAWLATIQMANAVEAALSSGNPWPAGWENFDFNGDGIVEDDDKNTAIAPQRLFSTGFRVIS